MLSADLLRPERGIFLKKDTRKLITCIAVPLVSGMADFCRLPESVYRTLELTEHLPHA